MGDIQSLIEKAAAQVDEEQAKELSQKLRKAEFDYNDFLSPVSYTHLDVYKRQAQEGPSS